MLILYDEQFDKISKNTHNYMSMKTLYATVHGAESSPRM